MKRPIVNILFTIVLVFASSISFAQIDTNVHIIPWAPIKDEDILWTKRVWREIPVYEKQNASLRCDPTYPQEDVFANVLLNGINAGVFQAYSDDLFAGKGQKQPDSVDYLDYGDDSVNKNAAIPLNLMHPLTKEEVNKRIACDPADLSATTRRYLNFYALHKKDTLLFPAEHAETKKTKRRKRQQETEPEQAVLFNDTTAVSACAYPQQVSHYAIKEDWIFDKGRGQMVVRIVAIAPMVNGKALFWVRYLDIRRYIARYEAYNGGINAQYTWDEYFESRQFSSKITKVSNPFGTQENKTDY